MSEMSLAEFEQPPKRDLSEPQERRLLKFYLSGDPGGGAWAPMSGLIRKGHVKETNGRLGITEKGQHYLHHHHSKISLSLYSDYAPKHG